MVFTSLQLRKLRLKEWNIFPKYTLLGNWQNWAWAQVIWFQIPYAQWFQIQPPGQQSEAFQGPYSKNRFLERTQAQFIYRLASCNGLRKADSKSGWSPTWPEEQIDCSLLWFWKPTVLLIYFLRSCVFVSEQAKNFKASALTGIDLS